MSKLAQVAERIAQTRRWLDQEADRLADRLDQIEKRAPAAFQNAHRILDEQQRDLDATEQMVQQWLSASAEVSGASNKSRAPQQAARSSTRAQPKPNDGASAPKLYRAAVSLLAETRLTVARRCPPSRSGWRLVDQAGGLRS